jgi:hypothetical protein
LVQDGSLDRYWTSALAYAFVARCAMHRGDLERARKYVAWAARLRPLLSYELPVVSAQALLELARCYIGLGDTGGPRAAPSAGHLPAATMPRRPAETGSRAAHQSEQRFRGDTGSIITHHGRAATPAATVHPPHPTGSAKS